MSLPVVIAVGALTGAAILAGAVGAGQFLWWLADKARQPMATVPRQRLPTRIPADEDDEPREMLDQT